MLQVCRFGLLGNSLFLLFINFVHIILMRGCLPLEFVGAFMVVTFAHLPLELHCSVKDRIALSMIERAERQGEIAPGRTILVRAEGLAGGNCRTATAQRE